MGLIIYILLVVILGLFGLMCFNKVLECICDMHFYNEHKYDTCFREDHIVYNKKTHEIEGDSQIVLPFE